ncbi:hypothetical protein BD626DRAFT_494253 [Schizophyllum amplum]|uniref:Uncharacterized protein n=1 Tax=Schizophyllum amplum TaxID=97359 RepID=A0A550CF18_9AGAR|nr:hypothetical protein BD626DRAFT_494253 [Auriculariopsis ampla]
MWLRAGTSGSLARIRRMKQCPHVVRRRCAPSPSARPSAAWASPRPRPRCRHAAPEASRPRSKARTIPHCRGGATRRPCVASDHVVVPRVRARLASLPSGARLETWRLDVPIHTSTSESNVTPATRASLSPSAMQTSSRSVEHVIGLAIEDCR